MCRNCSLWFPENFVYLNFQETLSPEVLARGRSCMEEKLAGTDSSSLKVFNESLDVADKCFKILKGNSDKESFILCLESNLSETALKHAKESITVRITHFYNWYIIQIDPISTVLLEAAIPTMSWNFQLGQSLNVCLENALSEMKDTTPETAVHWTNNSDGFQRQISVLISSEFLSN